MLAVELPRRPRQLLHQQPALLLVRYRNQPPIDLAMEPARVSPPSAEGNPAQPAIPPVFPVPDAGTPDTRAAMPGGKVTAASPEAETFIPERKNPSPRFARSFSAGSKRLLVSRKKKLTREPDAAVI